jgi:hypothetical protein
MFSFLDPKIVFSTVVERRTDQLFRMTQIEKVAVRIAWSGGDKFIALVGNEKLDALLVADYYGLDLRELATRYNENQERPLIYTETQARNQHVIAEQKKEVQPNISGLAQMT